MKRTNLETVSAGLKSLKRIQGKMQDVMIDEEKEYEKLSESDRKGEPGAQLGFEIDALDNIDYLINEVVTFIEENLGDRLS